VARQRAARSAPGRLPGGPGGAAAAEEAEVDGIEVDTSWYRCLHEDDASFPAALLSAAACCCRVRSIVSVERHGRSLGDTQSTFVCPSSHATRMLFCRTPISGGACDTSNHRVRERSSAYRGHKASALLSMQSLATFQAHGVDPAARLCCGISKAIWQIHRGDLAALMRPGQVCIANSIT
jgi:hypothetical protein